MASRRRAAGSSGVPQLSDKRIRTPGDGPKRPEREQVERSVARL